MTGLVIRGGLVVTLDGERRADVAIDGGVISDVAPELAGGREEIDARGLAVLPGLVDVHVHFNEPGRTSWEGAATGSRALAAGGGTLFLDMPLNSVPCVVDAAAFDAKRAALEACTVTDFGLWAGLVPGHVEDMAALAARGAAGFKAFMCDSGLSEFPRADDATLLDGMREAARLGLPVAVHAESEEITRALAARRTGDGVRDFLASRPVVAEIEAIQRALLFAAETGVRLHIVHVSSGRGVVVAAQARTAGVDVTIETCPHYLFFTDDDVEQIGAVAKCAPPLRDAATREALWRELLASHVDIVASDHSPCDPQLKEGSFVHAWGGIAGVQSTLQVLLAAGHHGRQLPLERVARLTATRPAARFGLRGKGAVQVGHDADLVLVDLSASCTVEASDLQQRHKASPYVGATLRGRVRRTIRRGETIFADGRIMASTPGRFISPSPTE